MPHLGAVLCLDWSGFDRLASHDCIYDIMNDVLFHMFNFDDGYHPTFSYPKTVCKRERLIRIFEWCVSNMLRAPLLLPNGKLVFFEHSGIFSGYYITQLIDSLYNYVMLNYCFSKFGFDISKIKIKVQGDDSVILLPYPYDLLKHNLIPSIDYIASQAFGAKLNVAKSSIHPSMQGIDVFKYSNDNGMPDRNKFELCALLYHPERSMSLESLMSRTIGIAYANCYKHQDVYIICENIFNYLKKKGIKPDSRGLLEFTHMFGVNDPILDQVLDFPTPFQTFSRLLDDHRSLPSERFWPTNFFIGVPR